MAKCPNCGNSGFIAKPYPEESHCDHCGASFFGSDRPIFTKFQKLHCKKCKRTWAYQGKKEWSADYPVYTSCPRCKGPVRIPKP